MFRPEEVLFCPTTDCNLECLHCVTEKSKKILSKKSAIGFLDNCKNAGIEKVGFTGGEPFLALDFLCTIAKESVKRGMVFDRIMTNGVWFRSSGEIKKAFEKLNSAGYDGSICVSVDAFHKQNIGKLAFFIEKASLFWDIYIASVTGARDKETKEKLKRLSGLLKKKLRIIKIDLSPIGRASCLKNPWDGKWFREDYCQGPGNVYLVMPNGDIKPCCGYASDLKELTIGNIIKDGLGQKVLAQGQALSGRGRSSTRKCLHFRVSTISNRFVYTVFNSGLSAIRKRLEKIGIRFPGKTSNHCFFCYYILRNVSGDVLRMWLD